MAALLAVIVASVVWMLLLFALIRWVVKKLHWPNLPVTVVALVAYVVSFLVAGAVLTAGNWQRKALIYALAAVLAMAVDGLLSRKFGGVSGAGEGQ